MKNHKLYSYTKSIQIKKKHFISSLSYKLSIYDELKKTQDNFQRKKIEFKRKMTKTNVNFKKSTLNNMKTIIHNIRCQKIVCHFLKFYHKPIINKISTCKDIQINLFNVFLCCISYYYYYYYYYRYLQT